MRLTLRTLLSYLDDALHPADAKEISNQLAESKLAADLVNRIDEALQFDAPRLDGADGSLDANVMAAYLENTLPPDQVNVVETKCLESDIHLAEAAASHKILTLMLRKPLEISEDSRRRMYERFERLKQQQRLQRDVQKDPAAAIVSPGAGDRAEAIAAAIKPALAEHTDGNLDEMTFARQPEKRSEAIRARVLAHSRSRPVWQRALPIFLIATAIGLFFLLKASVQSDRGWLSGLWKKRATTSADAVATADAPQVTEKKEDARPAPGPSDATVPRPTTAVPRPTTAPPRKTEAETPIVPPRASPLHTAPTIVASPNPIPANSKSTTIVYDVGLATSGEVYVSTDGGAETLVVRGKKGVKQVDWIGKGTYEFRLYEGLERKNRLAAVTVSRRAK